MIEMSRSEGRCERRQPGEESKARVNINLLTFYASTK